MAPVKYSIEEAKKLAQLPEGEQLQRMLNDANDLIDKLEDEKAVLLERLGKLETEKVS